MTRSAEYAAHAARFHPPLPCRAFPGLGPQWPVSSSRRCLSAVPRLTRRGCPRGREGAGCTRRWKSRTWRRSTSTARPSTGRCRSLPPRRTGRIPRDWAVPEAARSPAALGRQEALRQGALPPLVAPPGRARARVRRAGGWPAGRRVFAGRAYLQARGWGGGGDARAWAGRRGSTTRRCAGWAAPSRAPPRPPPPPHSRHAPARAHPRWHRSAARRPAIPAPPRPRCLLGGRGRGGEAALQTPTPHLATPPRTTRTSAAKAGGVASAPGLAGAQPDLRRRASVPARIDADCAPGPGAPACR